MMIRQGEERVSNCNKLSNSLVITIRSAVQEALESGIRTSAAAAHEVIESVDVDAELIITLSETREESRNRRIIGEVKIKSIRNRIVSSEEAECSDKELLDTGADHFLFY